VVHGIGAAATDADYFDDGRFSLWEIDFHSKIIYARRAISSARFTPLKTLFVRMCVGLKRSRNFVFVN
jgi:hypothetical protein